MASHRANGPLVILELLPLEYPHSASHVAFNHNVTVCAYSFYSAARKVYYVVIDAEHPIRLCFRKKVSALQWLHIDSRDILFTAFESGYIGCFDVSGRLLFKQQLDSSPIVSVSFHHSHSADSDHWTVPHLFCRLTRGVIVVSAESIYSTLKWSNFDLSLLTLSQRTAYFLDLEAEKARRDQRQSQYPRPRSLSMYHSQRHQAQNQDDFKLDRSLNLKPSKFPRAKASVSSLSTSSASKRKRDRNEYGVHSIPITTILPLRPIWNQIQCWNAIKIAVPNTQNVTCFGACSLVLFRSLTLNDMTWHDMF